MPPQNNHFVSIIIPSVRGKGNITEVTAALRQQTRAADEIIVVHDEKRQGAAWARNQGFAQCKGELIAFLDDDCLPPPNWLETLINTIDNYQADGVGGTYEETDSLLRDWRKRQNLPDIEMEDTKGLVGTGGNLMFTRTWLNSCIEHDGYVFSEVPGIAEDWELITRSRHRNVKLIYTPVRVKHLKKITPVAYLKQQFSRGKGIAMLYKIQKISGDALINQKSLLWGQKKRGKSKAAKWMMVLWKKGLGPFDIDSFDRKSDFIVFWLGEKFQGLGFLWHMFNSRKEAKF